MTSELRYAEVREDGGLLMGTVVEYGDEYRLKGSSIELIERIEPGAFGDVEKSDVVLNFMHDRAMPLARTGGAGLTLTDSPERLEMRAKVVGDPDFDRAMRKVRNRVMRGLSVEFQVDKQGEVIKEVGTSITRVVKRAKLRAIGLVDLPAYPASTVEARDKRIRYFQDYAQFTRNFDDANRRTNIFLYV